MNCKKKKYKTKERERANEMERERENHGLIFFSLRPQNCTISSAMYLGFYLRHTQTLALVFNDDGSGGRSR